MSRWLVACYTGRTKGGILYPVGGDYPDLLSGDEDSSGNEAIDVLRPSPPQDTSAAWVYAWPLVGRPVVRRVLHRRPEYGGNVTW